MNRQQKEAVLMEAMSDKTLSFGCIIEYCWWKYNYIEDYDGCFMKWYNNWEIRDIDEWCWCCSSWSTYTDYKIIWHPVYLHNVLMWAEKKWYYFDIDNTSWFIVFIEKKVIQRDLSKDLYWQSDETIDKLFELLPANK